MIDYLKDWARRAAADLRSYATAAEQSGSPQLETEALVAELDDILNGRNLWKYRNANELKAKSLLDDL